MNRYLFLCGLKSCGKTSAGRHLDQSLNDSVFIDLDDVLLEESKEKNISTLYKMMGENMFRKYESEIFNKVINVCNENWHEKKFDFDGSYLVLEIDESTEKIMIEQKTFLW